MPITTARLNPFMNRVFVETGSYVGNGIASALKAGFQEIWSIEIDEKNFETCRTRFLGESRVHLVFGPSEEKFPEILASLKEPATMWLDAHGAPNFNMPLVDELEAIRKTGVRNHILLLDDMWESDQHAQTEYKLRERLLAINPDYSIYFIDGQDEGCPPIPKSIMVGDPRRYL